MKKIVLCYALCASVVAGWGFVRHREAERLENNVVALSEQVHHYRTRLDEAAASVQALQLRCDEFVKMRAADARLIRDLGIRLKRAETLSTTSLKSAVEFGVVLRDTIILHDTLRGFVWRDPWVRVEGVVGPDSVKCRVESVDTLRQVVHRVPRRFLFIKYGTKAIRQEIISSNPHTRILYAEYIELKKSRKVKKSR
jgi:hypothetical protein